MKATFMNGRQTEFIPRSGFRIITAIAFGILLELLPSHTVEAAVLEEFAYQQVRVRLMGIDNVPIRGANIYGYCRDLQLFWPDDVPGGPRWNESCLGKTGADGSVVVKIPKGKWSFFACGLSQRKRVVAAWTADEPIDQSGELLLRPESVRSLSFSLGNQQAEGQQLEQNRLFLKPKHLPVFVPVDVPLRKSIDFELPAEASFELWGQAHSQPRAPASIINWGWVSASERNTQREPAEPLAEFEFKGSPEQIGVTWELPWTPGLLGTVKVRTSSKLLLSSGRYQIGYRRLLGQLMGDFSGRRYEVEPETRVSLEFNDHLQGGLDVNTTSEVAHARLFVVDDNQHLLHQLLMRNGSPLEFQAAVRTPQGASPAKQTDDGEFEFSIRAEGAEQGEWQFLAPLALCQSQRFVRQEQVEIVSEHFHVKVPQILSDLAKNLLSQLDEVENEMRLTSGREKRRYDKTELIVSVDHRGASASHNGHYIRMDYRLFFNHTPAMGHTFLHELGHNFGLTHGGRHETVVEAARSYQGEILDGQKSKWLFIDRMNGISRKESWYPPTGIYLYCYSQGGVDFLKFISKYELRIRSTLGKSDFKGGEITAAVLSVALNRNLQDIVLQYGLIDSPEQYAKAFKQARVVVEAEQEKK
jgi:hypothetical protein